MNISSYQVKDGDLIEVQARSPSRSAVVLDATQSNERDVPEYLEVDHRAMKGRFARAPKLTDVPYPVTMEPNLVVEFYSSAKEGLLRLKKRSKRLLSMEPARWCRTYAPSRVPLSEQRKRLFWFFFPK